MSMEEMQEILDASLEENLKLQAIITQLRTRVKQLEDEVAHLTSAKHESLQVQNKRSASPSFDVGSSTSVAPDIEIDGAKPRSSKKPRLKAEVVIERSSSRATQKGKQRASVIPKTEIEEDPKVPTEPEPESWPEQVAADDLADSEEIPREDDDDGSHLEDVEKARNAGDEEVAKTYASAAAALAPKIKIDVKKGLELDAATIQSRIDAIGRDPFPVTLEPEIRDVWVSRNYMRVAYGGNMQEAFPGIGEEMLKKHGLNDFFYLNLLYHPNGPREPGYPGLWPVYLSQRASAFAGGMVAAKYTGPKCVGTRNSAPRMGMGSPCADYIPS
ncbi:hypothetical protein DENSPDRAFT_685458 [Dentipellis sp. KUC8613]|nr:hypothetical protein DENSPDRAFT_685458 [Dentipellis sp. KUC8613]